MPPIPNYRHATDWKRIKNFQRSEWQTRPDLVDPELIYLVDDLTNYVKGQFANSFCIIHVAYETGRHTEQSLHYQGRAVDLHFAGMSLINQYMTASMFSFGGIGVYPYWNRPGLHLELVRDPIATPTRSLRWWQDKKGDYRSIHDREFLEILINEAKFPLLKAVK